MALDRSTGVEEELVQNWRQWLLPTGTLEGVFTLFKSSSRERILDFTFNEVIPILPVANRRLVDITFFEQKRTWPSARLIESDAELIREVLHLRLDWNRRRSGFQFFEVQAGTEITGESRLFWLFHTNQDDYQAIFNLKYIQVNSIIGSTFVGYRIWRLDYPWGGALALGAMRQPQQREDSEP